MSATDVTTENRLLTGADHLESLRDDGMVVDGAKMLATGSALTHATFVGQNSAVQLEEGKAEDYALAFIVPMGAPGMKLISRPSYERAATSAWDAPLASRFDENDAVAVFDRVFVPWEDVLVYRDVACLSDYDLDGWTGDTWLDPGR